ncbi:PREDICTED: elicitor-responsive protein 3-like [Fragaria vesca subsp. vesca]|uniref:elicitor-responsive protein 3-like n=1 Tax=Fragaria vesca subsp. vesca TaxID=101020 RepID=UPI0002C2F6D4|nr:PREDICTED: elicitor-responsive protein 3-like [Fragaria vesca subsp. vesca]
MPQGTLDVHLMNAKGLKNTEFFGKMDPYVIIQCKNQEKRSKVATSQGSKPVWNEKFVFRVTEGVTELKLTIMDKDTAVRDDFVGELSIPLKTLFQEGKFPPMKYNVLRNKKYYGEIKVGLSFTPSVQRDISEESFGGWKESSL